MRRNLFAVVSLLALPAVACGGGEAPPPQAEVTEPDQPDFGYQPDAFSGGSGQSGRQGGTTGSGGSGSGAAPSGGSSGGGGQGASIATGPTDGGSVGQNASHYLNERTPKLVVEIDAVEGYEPASEAVSLLRSRLLSVVDKPGGVQFLPVEAVPGSRESLDAMERQHRDTWSSNEVAVMYILYVDGRFADNPNAAGVAHKSSSIAIYKEVMQDAATPLVTESAIEQAVLVHEAGHLLALVNLIYVSPRDHHDSDHPGHSKNPKSVMYWAVELDLVSQIFNGPPPTDFDADDRADLADLKSGKLP